MSDSVRPHRRQPTRLPRPWDSPGKNTGVGCHFLLQCMTVKSGSEVLSRVWLLATPWTAAYQACPSMGFSRQEYWSGVPLPSPICNAVESKVEISMGSLDSLGVMRHIAGRGNWTSAKGLAHRWQPGSLLHSPAWVCHLLLAGVTTPGFLWRSSRCTHSW